MMQCISTLVFASFLASALAGKFSISIEKTEKTLPKVVPCIDRNEGPQKLLKDRFLKHSSQAFIKAGQQSRGSPIEQENMFVYTTNISVGTPPQTFRAIVDLDWSDLFVPSSSCVSLSPLYCNPYNAAYNASASSTFYDNGTITHLSYGPVYAYTRLSEDVLTLADGLQVPGQVFHEVKYNEWVYDPFGPSSFDGVLGLSMGQPWMPGLVSQRPPPPGTETKALPSPFRNMIESNVLDENVFSIVWPNDSREKGSIVFGGYDEDLLDGELISYPLFPENTTSWQVELESISLIGDSDCGGKKVLVDRSLPNTEAFLMSLLPAISFPYSVAQSIVHHLNSWPSACNRFMAVDCDEVSSLPDLVIGLKGQNITLKGEDYVQKSQMPPNCVFRGEECLLMFDVQPYFQDKVVLGMPFLQKMMGVYNWDEKTVSCEFPKLLEKYDIVDFEAVGELKK